MLGSLDCMHVPWKNCPLAYQGQYTSGKQGHPTIILEAVADYNLWFWHVAFGFPGSLNDINVWDNSPLLKALLDGTFASIDFEFEIGGKVFNKLWFLVDGIYPKLSRFVKTLPVACGRMWKRYASWQEAARKDIERALGVLQSKFCIVRNPIEKWHIENIQETVTTCIILHNMMVEKRVEDGDEENVGFYEIYGDDGAVIDEEEEEEVLDPARDEVENHHQGARNSGNSLGKILVFSANFLENFYNFSGVNNNVCNLDINNHYSVSTITKPILIFTIFIFTVTLPNVLYLNLHFSKIVVSSITTLGH
jgi:hypothetical protein